MFNYSVVRNKTNGMDAIKLLDGPFEGIIFAYGKIDFKEFSDESNDLSISFEYELLDKGNKDFGNIEPFEAYLGKLLEHMIHSAIEQELQTAH